MPDIIIDSHTNEVLIPFVLPYDAFVSAGLYDGEKLLTPIFSGKRMLAGKHIERWNKKDFRGNDTTTKHDHIKVTYNNIAVSWEGVLMNTSRDKAGSGIYNGYSFTEDICIADNYLYMCNGYNEGQPSLHRTPLNDLRKHEYFFNQRVMIYSICSDGSKIFCTGIGTYAGDSYFFVFAINIIDGSQFTFSAGKNITLDQFFSGTYSTIAQQKNIKPTGSIAVQKKSNFFFLTYPAENIVEVYHKVTGSLVTTARVPGASKISIYPDDTLAISNDTTIQHYIVSTDGKLSAISSPLSYPNIADVVVSPDGSRLLFSQTGAIQQIRAVSTTTKAELLVKGQIGGNTTNHFITTNRFLFNQNASLAALPDNSFFVLDRGNYRIIKYTADGTYLDYIMWLPHTYAICVNKTNPSQVFAGLLEGVVDYSKELGEPGAWSMVRNFTTYDTTYENDFIGISDVCTFNNGLTYCVCHRKDNGMNEIVELTNAGLRGTGVLFGKGNLYLDGVYTIAEGGDPGTTFTTYRRSITGFNSANNPILGSQVTVFQIIKDGYSPVWSGNTGTFGERIGNLFITYDSTEGKFKWQSHGYHLGGIKEGATDFTFKTAWETGRDYNGPFADDERFENGSGTNYPGSKAVVVGDVIIMGHHGEFYKQGQSNMYKMFYKNGLYLGQFGTYGAIAKGPNPAKMAGNALSIWTALVDGKFYLYTNDESVHSGVHRWKGINIDNVRTIVYPYTKPGASVNLLGNGTELDLMQGLPYAAEVSNQTDGWERYPVSNLNGGWGQLWQVVTNKYDYKNPSISAFRASNEAGSTAYVQRRLALHHLGSWRLSFGFASWDNPSGRKSLNGKGSCIKVLDDTNKIIAVLDYRFMDSANGPIPCMTFNDIVVYSDNGEMAKKFNAVEIIYANAKLRFIFAGYPPISSLPYQAGARGENLNLFKMEFYYDGERIESYEPAIRSLKLYVDNENTH